MQDTPMIHPFMTMTAHDSGATELPCSKQILCVQKTKLYQQVDYKSRIYLQRKPGWLWKSASLEENEKHCF